MEVSKPGNSTFQGSKPWKLQVSRFPRLESPGFKGPNLGTSTFGGPKPWNLNVWEVQTLEPQRLGGPKLGTSMIGGPKPWNRNVWGSRPWNLNPKSGHSRFERLPGFSLLFGERFPRGPGGHQKGFLFFARFFVDTRLPNLGLLACKLQVCQAPALGHSKS